MSSPEWPATDLFRDCARGDAGAWEELLRQHGPVLRLITLRVVRRFGLQQEFESVFQDVWSDLFERRERVFGNFNPSFEGAEVPYLKTVAANAASDLCRRAVRHGSAEELFDSVPDPPPPPRAAAPALTLEEAVSILRKHLDTAQTERDLAIFRLYYRFGYSSVEISRLPGLDLSESGVESVLVVCRRVLRRAIHEKKDSREMGADGRSIQESGLG